MQHKDKMPSPETVRWGSGLFLCRHHTKGPLRLLRFVCQLMTSGFSDIVDQKDSFIARGLMITVTADDISNECVAFFSVGSCDPQLTEIAGSNHIRDPRIVFEILDCFHNVLQVAVPLASPPDLAAGGSGQSRAQFSSFHIFTFTNAALIRTDANMDYLLKRQVAFSTWLGSSEQLLQKCAEKRVPPSNKGIVILTAINELIQSAIETVHLGEQIRCIKKEAQARMIMEMEDIGASHCLNPPNNHATLFGRSPRVAHRRRAPRHVTGENVMSIVSNLKWNTKNEI